MAEHVAGSKCTHEYELGHTDRELKRPTRSRSQLCWNPPASREANHGVSDRAGSKGSRRDHRSRHSTNSSRLRTSAQRGLAGIRTLLWVSRRSPIGSTGVFERNIRLALETGRLPDQEDPVARKQRTNAPHEVLLCISAQMLKRLANPDDVNQLVPVRNRLDEILAAKVDGTAQTAKIAPGDVKGRLRNIDADNWMLVISSAIGLIEVNDHGQVGLPVRDHSRQVRCRPARS